ncbi:DNA polymerase beta [Massariosphaeria phaeospora]|uniref:DNA-directed DNA polymerase n=1 Tax=Massariosphaeria phaeospora TaxID=100035 RepID=A0A7C8IDM4_9PLEO|nr:DNA polymerase beta [Massariosphaeria phaeospora]
MDDEVPASPTVSTVSTSSEHGPVTAIPLLDLSSIPPIYLLSAHFQDEETREVENTLRRYGAPYTTDVSKAKVFIGRVGTKRRAEFELRSRKLKVEEVQEAKRGHSPIKQDAPPAKRTKVSGTLQKPIAVDDEGSTTEDEVQVGADSETEDEDVDQLPTSKRGTSVTSPPKVRQKSAVLVPVFENQTSADIVWVIKLDWFDASVSAHRLLPLGDHLVYKCKVLERPASTKPKSRSIKESFSSSKMAASQTTLATRPETAKDILERAKSDISGMATQSTYHTKRPGHGSRRFEGRTFAPSTIDAGKLVSSRAHLLQKTTSEYEGEDSDLPLPPDWVIKGVKYSCQRFTPGNGPNEDFIGLLKKIRTARTLIDDEIGVRAYSTIIAAIAAYPYRLTHPREIARLPGCDEKTSMLFVEWKNTGKIQAVDNYEEDEAMKVLRLFYDIWGVGPKTARHFYYQNHWTDLDDIIEFGWNDLDRVQQIGLKYYEEFLDGIPRPEVEHIASVVRDHAVRIRDNRITVTVVGGYRRGKTASGDADMIVSHPDLEATANLVKDMVDVLEEAEWITHTLTLSLHNTHRGQHTLPFRTTKASGAGFDTLDKALVVWQDPSWPTRAEDLARDPNTKNPNIHRRVDIIIAPWRTVGCAVMGWSGGTTFQRDLRRYAKKTKEWKFDSSGIRSRATGEVIQLEGPEGVTGTPEEAERKVFEGLGLEYVPPEMRCTY